MKKITTILCLMVSFAMAGDKHVPHSTVTFIIVPFKDVTKEMLELVAPAATNNLRHTVTGKDLVVLEMIQYKLPTDPMPTEKTNDVQWTAVQLDYNDKFEKLKYEWVHKLTPKILENYRQYNHAEIKVEMKKPEWAGTNSVEGAKEQ